MFNSKFRKKYSVLGGVFLGLAVVTIPASKFAMLNYYSYQAERAAANHTPSLAAEFRARALTWFDNATTRSMQADSYMKLAEAEKGQAQQLWVKKAEQEIQKAIGLNPSYYRPYFQLALIQALYFDNKKEAQKNLYLSLKNNPKSCQVRLTLMRLLIENNALVKAQNLLEQGLFYPIPSRYASIYLDYLAKLRLENGYPYQEEVHERIKKITKNNNDYSDLALIDKHLDTY